MTLAPSSRIINVKTVVVSQILKRLAQQRTSSLVYQNVDPFQAERELQSKQQLVEDLGTKNEQLTKKLETTHSELTQKVLDAMKNAEQVGFYTPFFRISYSTTHYFTYSLLYYF